MDRAIVYEQPQADDSSQNPKARKAADQANLQPDGSQSLQY
jgi:hypothetical protein